MKILLVEDERMAADYVQQGLRENGFVVEVSSRGDRGYSMAQNASYDLLILDIMLPGLDGWSIVRRLRSDGLHTPVLMLTARDAVEDRVRGLEIGADDYLVKPFAFAELLARVRSLLRRAPTAQEDVVRIADLELDRRRHQTMRKGKRLELTPKEFSLLTLLATHCGEALSRTLIAESVWDINFQCDSNVVEVHMRRLRAKVDDPFKKSLLSRIRG